MQAWSRNRAGAITKGLSQDEDSPTLQRRPCPASRTACGIAAGQPAHWWSVVPYDLSGFNSATEPYTNTPGAAPAPRLTMTSEPARFVKLSRGGGGNPPCISTMNRDNPAGPWAPPGCARPSGNLAPHPITPRTRCRARLAPARHVRGARRASRIGARWRVQSGSLGSAASGHSPSGVRRAPILVTTVRCPG